MALVACSDEVHAGLSFTTDPGGQSRDLIRLAARVHQPLPHALAQRDLPSSLATSSSSISGMAGKRRLLTATQLMTGRSDPTTLRCLLPHCRAIAALNDSRHLGSDTRPLNTPRAVLYAMWMHAPCGELHWRLAADFHPMHAAGRVAVHGAVHGAGHGAGCVGCLVCTSLCGHQ